MYLRLGAELELPWLRTQIGQLGVRTHWHGLARTKLLYMLNDNHRTLTAHILQTTQFHKNPKKMDRQWVTVNQLAADRYAQMVTEFKTMTALDLPVLSIAVNGIGYMLPTSCASQ